jgi:hypothetical protein
MPTPIISESWPRFVLPIVRKEWFQKLAEVASPVAQLYSDETSVASVEYSQGIGDTGLMPEYNSSTAEGAPAAIQYGGFNPLYETTFTHKEYAKGLAIERKLWDDNQSGVIKRRAQALGNSAANTIAAHRSSIFVYAFTASAPHLGGDAMALCSATHPTSLADSTSIVNLGSSALSYAAIVATQALGLAMKADDGTPMPIVYDKVVVPVALRGTLREILGSANVPGQADLTASAINNDGLSGIVDPYLTDANDWYMVSSAEAKLHLLWFWRVRPEMSMDPASDFNLVAKYRAYMRYSFGWDDWRFIFGHHL